MICSYCKINPSLPNFAWCVTCRKAYDKQRYQDKKELRKKQIITQRKRTHRWMSELKESQPCTDCKTYYPSICMEWDHLPGFVKINNVADLVRCGMKMAAEKEILKCELVCANCHAIRTESKR